ncbi:MAG: bifunctional adenosylcobinamide kinase/adenosylcobinamide-phosphate guanylyltransferase [Victivallales bacterium]|jgi:adenosylcobinamide kinase/adenosylcobinamide-phosphate guanylyltransferase|nr:bifunctional adenosylcobinamide kinase/adenosylcobinamide-phosphate guanylyltransferase [Victivallales bacterium]
MNSKIVLITGGARSGKSSLAEKLSLECVDKVCYIATAPMLDSEMAERVRLHRERRDAFDWITIEEECDLLSAIDQAKSGKANGVLIDCLTLWINNLLYKNPDFTEAQMAKKTREIVESLRANSLFAVLVINEVGLGIVPETPLARRFRDLSGRCAQIVAEAADEVYFCVVGIARRIK